MNILLIHWNAAETEDRAERLRALPATITCFTNPEKGAGLRSFRANPPDAIVIDLSRLPSHGRAVGISFREHKATRHVPLIFVDGDAEKVARLRELLPDANYTTWPRINSAIKKAISRPLADPIVPKTMDAYSGTPLPKKLGVKPGINVLLISAPQDFEAQLLTGAAEPPIIRRQARSAANSDLIVLFVKSEADLHKRLPIAKRAMRDGGSIWIAWPKKTSGVKTDLSEQVVRTTGLASGLVDYKICAIDNIWSGLRFARQKEPK